MATEAKHADLLADLLDSTRIVDRNAGYGKRDIEINHGIDSVFVDIGCDELPITVTGTLQQGDEFYNLRFTLEHYYRATGKAEYAIELV